MILNLATIGTSAITEEFVQASKLTNMYYYQSAYSRQLEKAQKFAQKNGANQAVADLDALFNDEDIDVIYIASPNSFHFEQVMAAVDANKHVIIEKPAFSNLREWEQVHQLATTRQVMVLEAARHIHTDNYHSLKETVSSLMSSKKYPFLGAQFNIGQYSSRYDKYQMAIQENKQVPNIFNLDLSGGTVMDIGIYPLYVAIDLFGQPEDVHYQAVKGENGADLYGSIHLIYPNSLVNLSISKAVYSVLHNEIYFDNQAVIIPNITDIDSVTLIDSQGNESVISDTKPQNRMVDEARVFAQVIANQERKHYNQLKQLSYDVHQTLEKLRQTADLVFLADH